jgi:hypothetical protein
MFQHERVEATVRLQDAIRFRQKAAGYWHPDTLTDRNAIALTSVVFKSSKSEDDILAQFGGVAFVQFLTPPLGRKQEHQELIERTKELIKQDTELSDLLEELTIYPSASTLDNAKEVIAFFEVITGN